MTILAETNKMNLKLEFDDGLVGDKQKIISKTFTKLKIDALDESIYKTAKALEGLQEKRVVNVKKVEETSLKEA